MILPVHNVTRCTICVYVLVNYSCLFFVLFHLIKLAVFPTFMPALYAPLLRPPIQGRPSFVILD